MSKRLNIETSACEREINLERKNIVRVQETPLVDGCRKGLVPETERVRFDEVQLQIPPQEMNLLLCSLEMKTETSFCGSRSAPGRLSPSPSSH